MKLAPTVRPFEQLDQSSINYYGQLAMSDIPMFASQLHGDSNKSSGPD